MKIILTFFCLIGTLNSYSQTGIGTTTPNASAKLEIASVDKGFLLPRMTASQKTGISLPANGLLIYQTDDVPGFFVNSGSSASPVWTRINMDWIKTGNDISYTAGNVSGMSRGQSKTL